MVSIHFVCKRGFNVSVRDSSRNQYSSGDWDISIEDARRLIGGTLHLHERKSEPSYFGGLIISFDQVALPELAHAKRIRFLIQSMATAKGVRWSGLDHARAWSSGVVGD